MAKRSDETRRTEETGRTELRSDSRDYPERNTNYVVPDGEELKDKKARDRRLLKESEVDQETLDHEDVDPELLDAHALEEHLQETLNVAELPTEEVSYEELDEEDNASHEYDTTRGDFIDTAHSDGSTRDPKMAWEQSLVYTPPDDPPVIPSDDLQNVETGAGYGSSIEEAGAIAEDFPDRVDGNDADVEFKVREALRHNSETTTLDNLHVRVRNGNVLITGSVEFDQDVELIDSVVRFIDGVADVHYELRIAGDEDGGEFDDELEAELDEAELTDDDLPDADIAGIDSVEEWEDEVREDADAEELNEFGIPDVSPDEEESESERSASGRGSAR